MTIADVNVGPAPPRPVVYTAREQFADACIHLLGVPVGAAAAVKLLASVWSGASATLLAACGLYAAGLVLMLSLSAAYNLAARPAWKEKLRRWDHAAIFAMIAGTYTPLALVALPPRSGLMLFAYMWTVALTGMAIKLIWPRRLERLSIGLYLLLGWTFIGLWKPLVAVLAPAGLWLLAAGAVLYTVGVGFHLAERLRYHNAIWHAFVLAAAACHYMAILRYVALPALSP